MAFCSAKRTISINWVCCSMLSDVVASWYIWGFWVSKAAGQIHVSRGHGKDNKEKKKKKERSGTYCQELV